MYKYASSTFQTPASAFLENYLDSDYKINNTIVILNTIKRNI